MGGGTLGESPLATNSKRSKFFENFVYCWNGVVGRCWVGEVPGAGTIESLRQRCMYKSMQVNLTIGISPMDDYISNWPCFPSTALHCFWESCLHVYPFCSCCLIQTSAAAARHDKDTGLNFGGDAHTEICNARAFTLGR